MNELRYTKGVLSPNPKIKPHKYGIYVIRDGSEIVRVGESASGYSRIRKGFQQAFQKTLRGKKRKNYLAYSWRTKYIDKELIIDYFPLPDGEFSDDSFRRALEAEITFHIRIHAKKWPVDMIEIHFSESYRKKALIQDTCAKILSEYGIKINQNI